MTILLFLHMRLVYLNFESPLLTYSPLVTSYRRQLSQSSQFNKSLKDQVHLPLDFRLFLVFPLKHLFITAASSRVQP